MAVLLICACMMAFLQMEMKSLCFIRLRNHVCPVNPCNRRPPGDMICDKAT